MSQPLTQWRCAPIANIALRAEQLDLGILAAKALHKLDDDLDQLVANWQQTLLENLEDPFSKESIALLPDASKKLINAFLTSRKLPDPVTSEFASAVQLALVGLEKVVVKGDEIKQALLLGGFAGHAQGCPRTL